MKIYIAQIFIVKFLIELWGLMDKHSLFVVALWMITSIILIFPVAYMSSLQDEYPKIKSLNKRRERKNE